MNAPAIKVYITQPSLAEWDRAIAIALAKREVAAAKEATDTRRLKAARKALRAATHAHLRAELSPQPKPKAGLLERFWGFLSWK